MNAMNARRLQGFSLIELMVAMTIGIILTMLIGQIFINSRQIFASTDSLSRLQENARYALTVLTREIRLSTYKADPREPRYDIGGVANTGAFGTNATFGGTDGGSSGTPASGLPDTFWVRFQGSGNGTGTADGTVQDCAGARIDAPPATAPTTSVVNTFFIQADPTNNNEPTLFCNAGATAGTCAAGAAGCIALVPGVENMQVTYGEDRVGAPPGTLSPDGSIDRFVDGGTVGNWDNILSVRISLLMRTDDRMANMPTPASFSYSMVGTNVYAPGNDSRLRRVFTTVIDLRNRTQ